jgi:hypothetical protein
MGLGCHRKKERARAMLCWAERGVRELGQAWEEEVGCGVDCFSTSLFIFQSNSIYLNSKSNLDSNSYALT